MQFLDIVDFTISPITHLILTFMSMHVLVCVKLSKGSAGYPAGYSAIKCLIFNNKNPFRQTDKSINSLYYSNKGHRRFGAIIGFFK